MRTLIVTVLFFAAGTALAAPASKADRDRARRLWRDAVSDFDLGRYDDAIAKYEAAYRVLADPLILYNLGQTHRQAGHYQEAILHLRSYLRNKPDAPNFREVEGLIGELEAMVANQKKSNERPPDRPVPPPAAGPPVIAAVVEPRQPVERRWHQDRFGWSLIGGGLVAAGVGTGLLIHAGGLSSDAMDTLDQIAARDLHASARRYQVAGGIVLGIGLAAVGSGVVSMVLTDGRSVSVAGRF